MNERAWKKVKRKEEKDAEREVVRILTSKRLSALKAMLEKDHAIDCILLSLIGRGRWKQAKDFMKELRLTLPDGTFRARMMEIEYNGLVRHEKLDSNAKKKRWVATELGKYFGTLLLEFFGNIADGGSD